MLRTFRIFFKHTAQSKWLLLHQKSHVEPKNPLEQKGLLLPLVSRALFMFLILLAFFFALQSPFLTGISMEKRPMESVPKESVPKESVPKESVAKGKAVLVDQEIHSEFTYRSNTMLTLQMTFPQIELSGDEGTQKAINDHYQSAAKKFYNRAYDLTDDVIADYKSAVQTDYPFVPYDAILKYSVTLNANCFLSTYFDQYEYLGGAHGFTIRVSDNWDLQTGRRLTLKDVLKNAKNARKIVLGQILLLADEQMRIEPIYFEEYRDLIVKNFNEKSFFLTPNGVSVFFQQYDIGPYATGIIVFEIPYKNLGLAVPSCSTK